MKRLATLLIATLAAIPHAAGQPAPGCVRPAAGACSLGASATICAQPGLEELAAYLAAHLPLEVNPSYADEEVVVLATDGALAEEGYRLAVLPRRIEITGGGYAGVFNGVQRLLRMLPAAVYAGRLALPATVACCTTEDAPAFGYRGLMLDVARTWSGPESVKRCIDLMAYHSLNKLHLHLADDEGWRIEIRSHPELALEGGFRGEGSPVRAVYGRWGERYGGYFTQEEMRALIRYAAVRNVEIIPEIDLPGHSRCIGAVHPEIRCAYAPDTAATAGYDYRSAWCVAREENYALLEDILGEICELFPSPYIHIGGDEVEVSQWERCPRCRELMRRTGIVDAHRLQDRFMDRVTAILERHGKRPAVWNEAAASGAIARHSRVHGWQDVKACLAAVDAGYETVVMPADPFYLDMRQSSREPGHDWAAVIDARKLFGFDLPAAGFTPARMARVAGLECAFWSETHLSNESERAGYLDRMLFPRLCVLAHKAWGGSDEDWESYFERLKREHYDRMAAMGIRFRMFPPEVAYRDGALAATVLDRGEIRYTVDGEAGDHPYTHPIQTREPHRYAFFVRYKTGCSPEAAHPSRYRTIRPAATLRTSMGEGRSSSWQHAATYKGYARTRRSCRAGDWILYEFAEPVGCRKMAIRTGYKQLPRAIFTAGYAEVSEDGTHFRRAGELHNGGIVLRPDRPIKAVRLVATRTGDGTPFVMVQPPEILPAL